MPLLGTGALAMWWDMAPGTMQEFEHWHSHEHFPERLGIPGFRRGTRWKSADGGEGVFVMYEVDSHDTLSSPAYLACLNAPTPWSTKLMPHHRNMVRAQCEVRASRGGGVSRYAMTIRFAPAALGADAPSNARSLLDRVAEPGLIGAHLLQHRAPDIRVTTEQQIRGNADRAADWILVATGYELPGLEKLSASIVAESSGGTPVASTIGLYALSHSATPADVR